MPKFAASKPSSSLFLNPATHGFWLAVVCLVAFHIYAPTLGNQLVYDDRALIEQNPLLKDLRNVPALFFTDLWGGVGTPSTAEPVEDDPATQRRRYRPMLMLSYALNYAAGGTNPIGYHLVNMLFHGVASALFLLVAMEMGWSLLGAVIASAVFAVHPLHVEAVAWVAGRPEMMMAIGMFGALFCHLRGRRTSAVALFLFSLFSKEQAVVFPVLVLIADSVNRSAEHWQSTMRSRLPSYGAYLLVLILFLTLRTVIMGGFHPSPYPFSDNPLEHSQGLEWFLSVAKLAGYYLWLTLWPLSLSIDYSYDALPLTSTVTDTGVLWAMAAWSSLIILGIWSWRRDRRITFAVAMTVFTFLPVANLFVPVGTPFAERLFYVPLGGLCLLVGLFLEAILRRTGQVNWQRQATVGICVVLLVGLAARTVIRLQDWKTSETLFRSATMAMPTSARAHFLLGSELLGQGKPEGVTEGLKELEAALAIYPDYVKSDAVLANNLGIALVQLGRHEEARFILEEAIVLRPRWAIPYHHLGFAYMKIGEPEKAIDAWRTTIKLAPDDMLVRLRLGRLLIQQKRYEEGLAEADAVLIRDSEFASGHINRGAALLGLGRVREAQAAYEHVLAMPTAPDIAKTEAKQRLEALSLTLQSSNAAGL